MDKQARFDLLMFRRFGLRFRCSACCKVRAGGWLISIPYYNTASLFVFSSLAHTVLFADHDA